MKITAYRRSCLRLQARSGQKQSPGGLPDIVWFWLLRGIHRREKSPYLPVHHRTKSLYIHIPKAGGNSVTRIVYDCASPKAGSHKAAWEYQAFDAKRFADYFVFATVRHPLTRMRSAFYYLKAGGNNAGDRAWGERVLAPFDDFRTFLTALEADAGLRGRVMGWIHFLPQRYFLCDPHGLPIVDYLVRTEDFDTGMREVCRRLHIDYAPCRDNITPQDVLRDEDLTGAPARICFELYRQDYELLHYPLMPEGPNAAET